MGAAWGSGYRFGAVMLGAALVACGGGGESGGSGASGGAATMVGITASNASQVASDAFAATNSAVSGANTATDLVVPFAANNNAAPTFSLRGFADAYLQRLRIRSSSQLVTAQAVYTDSNACSDGGTYADSWNDADNDFTDSPGDVYSTTYTNCVAGGVTTNGGVSATLVSFSGAVSADYTMSGTFDFSNLTVSYSGYSAGINGDMTYRARRVGSADTATISIPSLTISEPNGRTTIANATLQYSYDTVSFAYSYSVSATISSTAIGGAVAVATLVPFAGSGAGYPASGSMSVTGAGNSSVTLTATGGGNVRLDVDSNGDGVTDSTTHTTWAALAAL